jgi:quinol monooxygenase YgiN
MIRVIVERKLKKTEDIGALLLRLRAAAMSHKGHISSEALVGAEDRSLITVISNWKYLEDWKAWETSKERTEIDRLVQPLLAKRAKITTLELISSEEQEYLENPTAWMQKREHPDFQG